MKKNNDSPNNETDYYFGELKEYNLEEIEAEVLNESIYLDVFAGSDLRLKEDIKPLDEPLKKLMQISGVKYQWNEKAIANGGQKGGRIGFIAQEVATVIPELVAVNSKDGMMAISYSKMTPYLVEGIRELSKKVDAQEKRIAELEKLLLKK